jgi:O-antigen/teichoic acid export membrane protein
MAGLTKLIRDPLYRNSLFLMLNAGLVSLYNYVFRLIAGHLTSSGHIGLATEAVAAAAMIVAIARLGMDDGLTRFFPPAKDKGGFYNALIAIMLLVTVVVFAGFILGLPYISPAILFLRNWQYLLLFIGFVFLTSVCDMQGTAFVAIRRADLALLEYAILVLRIPLLILLGALGVFGIFLALDITYLIMMAAGIVLLYKMGIARDLHVNIGEARKTARYSLGNYTATIIYTAPLTLIPILIVNVTGASQGAYFYVAYSVAMFLFLVPDAIAASMFVEGSHERPLKTTAYKSPRFAFIILAPLVMAIVVFGDDILLLFSPEYLAAAYQLLLLLTISSLFYAIVTVYVTVVRVQKNVILLNYIRLTVTGLTLLLSYVLLHKIGLIGIGYAWLLSHVIMAVFAVWMMLVKTKW